MFDDAPVGIPTGGAATAWSGSAPLITPEPWMQDAACLQVDPDLFFPSKGDGPAGRAARGVCATCDVVAECLAFALRTKQTKGFWGGKSPRELAEIRTANGQGEVLVLRPRNGNECTVPSCWEKHSALGFCRSHYYQWRKERAA